MRARALRGSPWLPVVTMMVWTGRQALQVPHGDLQAGGDLQVAQFLGQSGVDQHGLAVEQHPASELGGDVDDLLHPVDVGGKGGDDDPAGRLPDEALQGDADLPLGNRVPGPLGVGGVGHQDQDAGFAVMGKAVQVHGAAGNRGLVDLEIAGMDQEALGGAHHEPDAVHDGVAHPDEFELKGPQGQGLPGVDFPQVGVLDQAVFPELFLDQGQGQGGAVHRQRDFLEEKRHGADVVFVAVGEDQGRHFVPAFLEVGEIGDNDVDPQHLVLGKHEAGVHHHQVVGGLQGHQVEADFPQAPQEGQVDPVRSVRGFRGHRGSRGRSGRRWPDAPRP